MLVGVVLIESSTSRGTATVPGTPEKPFYIAAFPDDDAYWRVDWSGEIAYPDRYTRRKHPSILIYLSKFTESNLSADPKVTERYARRRPHDNKNKAFGSSKMRLNKGKIQSRMMSV
jgi:hypothetical protein